MVMCSWCDKREATIWTGSLVGCHRCALLAEKRRVKQWARDSLASLGYGWSGHMPNDALDHILGQLEACGLKLPPTPQRLIEPAERAEMERVDPELERMFKRK